MLANSEAALKLVTLGFIINLKGMVDLKAKTFKMSSDGHTNLLKKDVYLILF